MSNEIKQGDKVRVSKDAPKLIFGSCDMSQIVCTVCCVDKDVAAINLINDERIEMKVWIVPTKYLVKVDAEAKEPKFKYQVGQKVKSAYADEILTIKERCGRVGHDNVYRVEEYTYTWNECELKPYTATTEQTEAEKTKTKGDTLTFPIAIDLNEAMEGCDCFVSIREQIRKAQREIKENNKPRYVPKIIFNTEFWVKYEADLAKEVALKVANKYNDPEQAAEYAISVAKAVVEGLKRK